MVSKKDRNSAVLETMRTSRSPTTVITANGEVQTREEAMDNVKQLDLFVKVMFLEETSRSTFSRKLCEDHGKTYHWTSGQNPHLIRNGTRIDCNKSNYVPFVVPGISASSSPTMSSSASSPSSSEESTSEHRDSVSENTHNTSNDPFSRCKCAINGYKKELTITAYSLTTSTKVNYKIQTKICTGYYVGVVTPNYTFNTAHMNTDT